MSTYLVIGLATLLAFSPDDPTTTESLILETLEDLSRTQKKDGRWKAPRKTPEKLTDAGVTGLALLSFVGAGHTHKFGKFKGNVARAREYLEGQVGDDGSVKGGTANQAIVARALAELYAVSRDKDLEEAAKGAIEGLLKRQLRDGSIGDPRTGRYFETLMAIQAIGKARQAGVEVDRNRSRAASIFLEQKVDPENLKLRRDPSPLDRRGALAAIYLGRMLSGAKKEESLQKALALEFVRGEYPAGDPRAAYVLTAALFQHGGDAWETYLKSQGEWMARDKRSKDLSGRIFEVLSLEVRLHWERMRRAEGGKD